MRLAKYICDRLIRLGFTAVRPEPDVVQLPDKDLTITVKPDVVEIVYHDMLSRGLHPDPVVDMVPLDDGLFRLMCCIQRDCAVAYDPLR